MYNTYVCNSFDESMNMITTSKFGNGRYEPKSQCENGLASRELSL